MKDITKFPAYFHDTLALIAGGLLPLAFAPFHLFWLSVLCPAIWLYCLAHTQNMKRIAWRGWLFGFGFFLTGISWVYISMHRFGGVNVAVASLLTVAFVAALGLVFLVYACVWRRLFPSNHLLNLLIAFPACWALFEWLREWFLTGFPWLFLAYSQIRSPLSGYTPIIGCYGTAFMTTLCSAFIVYAVLHKGKTRLWSIVGLVAVIALGALLHTIHWTKPTGKKLSVSLIQGNIPQSMKWNPQQVVPTLNTYETLTQNNWANLVVWPEAAVPITMMEAQTFLQKMDAQARQHHAALITGIPITTEGGNAFYNGALGIGEANGSYAKRHLVPFGEYIPLKTIAGNVMRILNIPLPDLVNGPEKQAGLTLNSTPIATFICYEIAYPNLLRSDLPRAQLLVNLSDDAWFGHSIAAEQQLEIAQTRALQSGRYLLASTNNGVTAIVNEKGDILSKLPRFKQGALHGNVLLMTGSTPWAMWGNTPIVIILLILLIIVRTRFRKKS
jgi:apolipoprotein N-acyltransferase